MTLSAETYDNVIDEIEVRFPDLTVNEGNLVNVPVTVITGQDNLSALQLNVKYDQDLLEFKSVLNSEKAILVNIQIIRAFTRIRETLLTHKDILLQLEKLENTSSKHSAEIKYIFDVLKKLIEKPKEERVMIGYKKK